MKILDQIIDYNAKSHSGLTDDLYAMIIAHNFSINDSSIIVLTNTVFEANKVYESIKLYCDDACLFLMDDFISSVVIAESPEMQINRLETIRKINENKKTIIITNLMGYLHFIPKISFEKQSKNIKINSIIDRDEFIQLLVEYGYNRTSLVTTTGEFAVRGFIVDYYGIEEEQPIRIEFFGNNVESIRYFDGMTQMSVDHIKKVTVYPYKEIVSEEKITLVDLLNNPTVYKYNSNQIKLANEKLQKDIGQYIKSSNQSETKKYMFNYLEINEKKVVEIDTINKTNNKIFCQSLINFDSNFESLEKFVNENILNDKTIIFCLTNDYQVKIIKTKFPSAIFCQDIEKIEQRRINIINKKIGNGFIIENFIFISDQNIEKHHVSRGQYRNTIKIGKRISNYDQLVIGDYVVHRVHGIGIYNGIVTIERNNLKIDYIQILYKGKDKIYIPVEKINTIFKHSSKDGATPVINKLNSLEWTKKKISIKKKIDGISRELILLYAERAQKKKPPYQNFVEEEVFAREFVYEPTPDQIKVLIDINNDLITSTPMDRLLCGDVGYGKTEVAFRTALKAVLNGYQVAYLCPTTILSKQQYLSAVDRFKNYAINIALLNRFISKKQEEKIYRDLENGKIDIVIGTHKLLNKKIIYKNLDMLIVDEEQKFGVMHKEIIKNMKKNINVLTLSATPIPRTLKIALSGIRDLSIIDTPPVNRYPVQTYVIEENDYVIREAIYKELTRDGQVFILYNRVSNIDEVANKISNLVPEANVIFAHGRMSKVELENTMQDYIDGKYNVMVCTTIIESGIDIPNVNTLIIIDADLFGLSQLYQLRGRVGRSDRIAYAYLMYNKQKILNSLAIKRLNSIQEFTELGSGYKIAVRDLAIRGAGDILGSEQAGFIDSIGIELYMKMVNEKIQELNGNPIKEDQDDKDLIDVENHINDDYVSDEAIKIEIHQKISEIDNKEKLNIVKAEIEDRFGSIDENINIYMHQSLFENTARQLSVSQLSQTNDRIELIIPENAIVGREDKEIFKKIYQIDPNILIKRHHKRLIITLILHKLNKHHIYYLVEILNVFKE